MTRQHTGRHDGHEGTDQAMSCTQPVTAPPVPRPASLQAPSAGMTWIPSGTFAMGSDDFHPEERPVRTVAVDGFWMDTRLVTVAEFRRFVRQTGYLTVAELAPDAAFPAGDPASLLPGSLVCPTAAGPDDRHDGGDWWSRVPGASWCHPEGPDSSILHRDKHPVTHVAYADALAYADWAGKALPAEAEWEYAARGGLHGAAFVWGDDLAPAGRQMANMWQGRRWQSLLWDHAGTSPVATFPANGYGLYDMAGNVWEWTCGDFRPGDPYASGFACCVPPDLRREAAVAAVAEPGARRQAGGITLRAIKGGSHLCAPDACLRFRPAARQGQPAGSGAGHLGFRCVLRPS